VKLAPVEVVHGQATMPTILRVRYSKLGKIRFTSHRDVGRMWERALRKIVLAVAYTAGFSPRPRIAFGFALPTGAESRSEYVDIALDAEKHHDLDGIVERLSAAMPDGIDVTAAALMPLQTTALQSAVVSSTWEIALPQSDPNTAQSDIDRLVQELLARDVVELEVERKGALVTSDIRPGILSAALNDTTVTCELAAKGTRPADFVRALGLDPLSARFLRINQWIELRGERAEPLAAGAALSPGGPREDLFEHVASRPLPIAGAPPASARLARGA
jgi:radical SAM-linked protein